MLLNCFYCGNILINSHHFIRIKSSMYMMLWGQFLKWSLPVFFYPVSGFRFLLREGERGTSVNFRRRGASRETEFKSPMGGHALEFLDGWGLS